MNAPGTDSEITPSKKISAPTIIFSLLLIVWLFFVITKRWLNPPFTYPKRLVPNLNVIFFNLKLLLHLKGGYATTLWGFLVFISISSWFYLTGNFLLRKILNFRQVPDSTKHLSIGELIACRWFLGSWICGMLWFLLGTLGLYKNSIAIGLIILGLIVSVKYIFTINKYFNSPDFISGLKLDLTTTILFVIGIWITSWATLAVFPQSYWDTLMNNMALPGYYVAESKLTPNPFNIYSYFPQNSEMLSVWTLLAHSKEAAYLLVWGFFAALMIFIYGWIGRVGSKLAALCSIAIFVSSQLGPWLGTLIKNDLQTAVFLILQWWALIAAFRKFPNRDSDTRNWIFLSGLFAGIALGHKLTALPSILVTVVGISLFMLYNATEKRIVSGVKLLFTFNLALIAAWSPWLIRSFLMTGNPIYPFLNNLLSIKPLYPWHTRPPSQFTLLDMGWNGFKEYIGNLSHCRLTGEMADASIWWGPSAWICITSFFCLTKIFSKEIRWICGIALISWIVSLFFALKPPYHAGPLIFILTCCFALALEKIFEEQKSPWLKFATVGIIALDFIKNLIALRIKEMVFYSLFILFSGFPLYQIMTNTGNIADYASIDEMDWIHHLVNKYAPKEDKVMFIGSVRPFGIERKHYAAFSLAKQPILYFAEQSKDGADLKNRLLSLGVNQLIYDPFVWKDWVHNHTVDGPHNIQFDAANVAKINQLITEHSVLRIATTSGKLGWYTIRTDDKQTFPPLPFDADDVYEYPLLYLKHANLLEAEGHGDLAKQLRLLLDHQVYVPNTSFHIHNALGITFRNEGDFDHAFQYFSRSIKENAHDTFAIRNRAEMYTTTGQYGSAIKDWSQAMKIDPNNPEFLGEYNRLIKLASAGR